MEPSLAIWLFLAIALLVVIVAAARRQRELQRIGEALVDATGAAVDEPRAAIIRLRARADDAEHAVEAERADIDPLMTTVDSGILRVGPDRLIRSANRAADDLLGRRGGSLLGRSLMEVFLAPEAEAVVAAAASGGVARTEIQAAGPDGPILLAAARTMPTGDTWLVVDDVSELRRLQRIRTEFIDNLSHELRTPLTTVSLLAETLAREAAASGEVIPPRMRDRIARIEVEAGHLVQMVNELLDLSRIEGGDPLALVDGVDLGSLVAESAERLSLFAERQGVSLSIEIESGLRSVRGDRPRLGQVVVNLVHNAVKFSPDGGDVTVAARADGSEVVVSVADHGVGIPAAALERVFERFYKVDRARRRVELGGGTGLGLAISRHVVEQHGGRIWVTSTEGVGSTFAFALPTADGVGED
jgi:two-component system phosphate regulon sensor histidine kinase PhoR